jgi:hypothetical protein
VAAHYASLVRQRLQNRHSRTVEQDFGPRKCCAYKIGLAHAADASATTSAARGVGDAAWRPVGKLAGVPDFGTLTFTNCFIDRKALASWHPHKYQRVHYVIVQIAPGALSPAGTAFATDYNHS